MNFDIYVMLHVMCLIFDVMEKEPYSSNIWLAFGIGIKGQLGIRQEQEI